MARTSKSHPLAIQTVTPLGTNGAIGMTLCPGRKGSSLEGGSWNRDLAMDLEAVRAWKPDAVIALLEQHEYAMLGIPHFRKAVAAAKLPWSFASMPDGGVPGTEFDAVWSDLGPRVRAVLRGGGRVLVHCRAGLGRTGLVAASLLVELGAEPQAAIDAVRASRPNTIETPAQEAYVRSRRPVEN
jgi:ADP-ribosyl-[dinitrogen reductase] hydrolase